METFFVLTSFALFVSVFLQKTSVFSNDFFERLLVSGGSVGTVIFLSVFISSVFSLPYPYIAGAVVEFLCISALLFRISKRGIETFASSSWVQALLVFAIFAVIFGIVFAFGTRYTIAMVDHVAHMQMMVNFAGSGTVDLSEPFRYPQLFAVLTSILSLAFPGIPVFYTYQCVNIFLLFAIAVAVRQIFVHVVRKTSLFVDLVAFVLVFSTLLLNGLLYGFSSMLAAIAEVVVLVLAILHYHQVRTWWALIPVVLLTLSVSATYFLFAPLALVLFYFGLFQAPGSAGRIKNWITALLRPRVLLSSFLVLIVSLFLVYFYLPHDLAGQSWFSHLLGGAGQSAQQSSLEGAYLSDLRFLLFLSPFAVIGAVRALKTNKFIFLFLSLSLLFLSATMVFAAAGKMSMYYFSKFEYLFFAAMLVAVLVGLRALKENFRAVYFTFGAGLILAGVFLFVAARLPFFSEGTQIGRGMTYLMRQVADVYSVNYDYLKKEAILSGDDQAGIDYINAHKSEIFDKGSGQLAATGVVYPLFYAERIGKLPLYLIEQGMFYDDWKVYFNGIKKLDEWLKDGNATHIMVMRRDGDMQGFIESLLAKGLSIEFQRGNFFLLKK